MWGCFDLVSRNFLIKYTPCLFHTLTNKNGTVWSGLLRSLTRFLNFELEGRLERTLLLICLFGELLKLVLLFFLLILDSLQNCISQVWPFIRQTELRCRFDHVKVFDKARLSLWVCCDLWFRLKVSLAHSAHGGRACCLYGYFRRFSSWHIRWNLPKTSQRG